MTLSLSSVLVLTVCVSVAYWLGWMTARVRWGLRAAIACGEAQGARLALDAACRELNRLRAAERRPGGRMLADVQTGHASPQLTDRHGERGEPA